MTMRQLPDVGQVTVWRTQSPRWNGVVQTVDSKDRQMSEWLKAHAWKANPARLTKSLLNTFSAIASTIYAFQVLLDVTP